MSQLPATRTLRPVAEIKTPAEAKAEIGKAEALRVCFKKAGAKLKDLNAVGLEKVLIERHGGGLLLNEPRAQGARNGKKGLRGIAPT